MIQDSFCVLIFSYQFIFFGMCCIEGIRTYLWCAHVYILFGLFGFGGFSIKKILVANLEILTLHFIIVMLSIFHCFVGTFHGSCSKKKDQWSLICWINLLIMYCCFFGPWIKGPNYVCACTKFIFDISCHYIILNKQKKILR